MEATTLTLACGNGGRLMKALITDYFLRHLGNPLLETLGDATALPPTGEGTIMTTTDGFAVQPLIFPGGSIGSLAVHGTCNDLAVAGADPLYLTLGAMFEEGFDLGTLSRILEDMAEACRHTGVRVVAGDTKVVGRGEGSGVYFTMAGIGLRPPACHWDMAHIQPGDKLVVSGPVGDHAVAVLLAREAYGLSGEMVSDCASVLPLTRAARAIPGVRFMRDPTRGGLATVCHDIASARRMVVVLEESAIPIRDQVRAFCHILGYDPLLLACEGRVVAVVANEDAPGLVDLWRALPEGRQAAIVGSLTSGPPLVSLLTHLGGRRIIEELEDDPLPRIC